MNVRMIQMVYISSTEILDALPMFVAICGAIILICFLVVRFVEAKNNKLPVNEYKAKIIDLRQDTVYGIIAVSWLLFELSDGTRVRLTTEAQNDFMVGDEGILKYQGERFISFTRGSTIISQTEIEMKNRAPRPEIEVTQAEIRQLMQKKDIPYGEAVVLARKIKMKQWENSRSRENE